MKGGRRAFGYTIVEVMIVLAVSSVMFLIAATFVSGKQASAAFTEGTNEFASQLQTTIAQVINGQYSDVALQCSSNGTTTTVSIGGNGQGTNNSCIFLGKVVFLAQGAYGPNYQVLPLAGARIVGSAPGGIVTPAQEAPAVIAPLISQEVVPQQLDVSSVQETDAGGATHNFVGIAFLEGLGSVDASGNPTGAGQNVSLYYINGLTPATAGVNSLLANGNNYKPAKTVTICVNDGKRYAELTLGSAAGSTNPQGSSLSVAVKVVTLC